MPEQPIYYTRKCFLCKGYGKITVINSEKTNRIKVIENCPICNGKSFLKIQKRGKL